MNPSEKQMVCETQKWRIESTFYLFNNVFFKITFPKSYQFEKRYTRNGTWSNPSEDAAARSKTWKVIEQLNSIRKVVITLRFNFFSLIKKTELLQTCISWKWLLVGTWILKSDRRQKDTDYHHVRQGIADESPDMARIFLPIFVFHLNIGKWSFDLVLAQELNLILWSTHHKERSQVGCVLMFLRLVAPLFFRKFLCSRLSCFLTLQFIGQSLNQSTTGSLCQPRVVMGNGN